MLDWAFTFLIIALVSAVLGFGGFEAGWTFIAKVYTLIFLLLFALAVWAERNDK
jgi:uncharacterized membrane protein YtjA (UPF0391 family)